MKYGALLGWGICIYAVLFLLWSGFMLYGYTTGLVPRLAGLAVLISLALLAGKSLRYASWKDIAPYSLAWTIEIVVLDMIFSVPFAGWALFADWNVWVGYLMVLFVPLLASTAQVRRLVHASENHA